MCTTGLADISSQLSLGLWSGKLAIFIFQNVVQADLLPSGMLRGGAPDNGAVERRGRP